MTGPTAKGEATRQEFLAAATELFAQRGYASTRMDDVIRATGLTRGAIYFHFRSKRNLALAIVEEHKLRWLSLASEEAARHDRPTDQLHALGELLVTLASRGGAGWNVVRLAEQIRAVEPAADEPPPSSPKPTPEAQQGCRPLLDWVELVAGIIESGHERGEFVPSLVASDSAVIMVSAFDGLKSASDALVPGDMGLFRQRAEALLAMFEARLAA